MKKNRTIGVHQFTVLVIFFGIGSSILIAPSPLAADAKQDAWIAAILGVIAGLLPIAVYISLSRRFPHKTIIEMNELVLGKWLGKVISFLYLVFFLLLGSMLLGDIGYFLTTDIMPETPIVFIMACLIIVVIMGIRLGPEVMARAAEIFFPWVILLLVLLILMLLPQMEAVKIQPVLENGWMPVLKAVFPFFSLQEYIILMMIVPFVKLSKKSGPAFYSGSLIAGGVIVMIVLLCILVLGPGLTASHNYPSFTLAKKISVGKFIERVEVIIGGIWFITITFKLALTLFGTALGMSQLFRFRSYTFITIPLGMFTTATTLLIYTNIVFVIDFVQRVWPAYSAVYMIVLPLLTWIVALLRKQQSHEPY